MRRNLGVLIGCLAFGQVVLTGCGDSTDPTGPDDASVRPVGAIEVVAGANQSVGPGEVVPISPVVRVTSDRGRPIRGAVVTLAPDAGLGALDATSLTTDSKGEATLPRWVAPLVAGEFAVSVTASAAASGKTVSVRITALVSDEASAVISQTIGPSGGVVTVDAPSSPLNGLTITVPPGALTSQTTFGVMSSPAPPPPMGLSLASPVVELSAGGITSDSLIRIRIPASTQGTGVLRAFVVTEDGMLVPLPSFDADAEAVVVGVRDFTSLESGAAHSAKAAEEVAPTMASLKLKFQIFWWKLPTSGVVETGFEVGVHNAGFANYGSIWAQGGYCLGSTVFAGSWFQRTAGSPLRAAFPSYLDAMDTGGWKYTDQLNPAIRLASALQVANPLQGWLHNQSHERVWENVLAQIHFTGQPVYISVRPDTGAGHAVLAYSVNLDLGHVYVADPNYPDSLRFLEWDRLRRSFDSFPSSPKADSETKFYIHFREATYFFEKERKEVSRVLDQYLTHSLPSQYAPLASRVILESGGVFPVEGDTTPIPVQSHDDSMELQAPGLDAGQIRWVRISNGTQTEGTECMSPGNESIRLGLDPGENKIGLLFLKATSPHVVEGDCYVSRWYDAKLLLVTRQEPPGIASIDVTPSSALLPLGRSLQLTATPRDSGGTAILGKMVTWASSDTSVAPVSSAGLVSGVAEGSATITATSEGTSGTALITVTTGSQLGVGSILSAGPDYTCGVTAEGAAYCWGRNSSGELGDGTTLTSLVPVPVSGDLTFASISANAGPSYAYSHSCGVTTGGAAYCWGRNASGELGDGTKAKSQVPVPVSGGLTFALISTGANHTCAVTTSGEAYCWGSNLYGKLGNGTTSNSSTPVLVAGGHTFASVSAGYYHTCGVTTGGAAYCWGNGGGGRLGNGSTANSPIPTPVSGGQQFTSTSAGSNHSCGVTVERAAYCWGDAGIYGRLGNDPPSSSLTPVPVSGGHQFVSISADIWHTCGVDTDGAAWCWGSGAAGKLGDGTGFTSKIPVGVLGGLVFTSVSTGDKHTCGLTTGGTCYCWGSGASGRLGHGTTESKSTPFPVSGALVFKMP